MNFTVSKEHRFESAHRLIKGYQGNCSNVHGHSWVARFFSKSVGLNQFGMVRDFSDFKLIRKWIDEILDHATIVCVDDHALVEWLAKNEQRYYLTPHNPTSEALSKILLDQCHILGLNDVFAVEIEETCTSKARYEK